MNRFFIYITLLAALLTSFSEPVKKEKPKAVIGMSKTPCFGFCSTYTIHIYRNGNLIYYGYAHTKKIGTWVKKIPRKDVSNLIREFKLAKYFEMQDAYTSQATDLPTIYTFFNYQCKYKKIKDYWDPPAELVHLEELIEKIADSEQGWAKIKELQDTPQF